MDERETAKATLRSVIRTAIRNTASVTGLRDDTDGAEALIEAILDQITQPQLAFALREISKTPRY